MLNFNDLLFRCSALGYIMPATKGKTKEEKIKDLDSEIVRLQDLQLTDKQEKRKTERSVKIFGLLKDLEN